ncbi:tropomyosin-like [Zingiber officinale]|uniref:tropomyosin-like n=1 Tax=Zingiber officinale TaxID=94328 RepID=UPI001C4A8550|nr:tropomyosin-like [Zingiber officinale]
MCQRLTFLEEEVKKMKASSGQSSAVQEQTNAEVAKLRADLEKSTKRLEAERDKSSRQATLLAQLNKQVATFNNKIESTNVRKNRDIEDLNLKNKEARALAQRLKEVEDFLVAE